MSEFDSSYDAGKEIFRNFSPIHGELLDLCVDHYPRRRQQILGGSIAPLEHEGQTLTSNDLITLAHMVKLDFRASVAKELNARSEDSVKAEPNVYDVWLMKVGFGQDQACRIAVLMPNHGRLDWWNGASEYWTSDSKASGQKIPCYQHKLTNLAGTARLLESLDAARTSSHVLLDAIMTRSGLITVPSAHGLDPLLKNEWNLNETQCQAIAAVADSAFTEGILCIQGPPGCGKTTTLVAMVSVAMKQRRGPVLVVAPSNAAVANIALKVWDKCGLDLSELCVYGMNCDESAQFLNPVFRSRRYKSLWSSLTKDSENQESNNRHVREFLNWAPFHLEDLEEALPTEQILSKLAGWCPVLQEQDNGSLSWEGRKQVAEMLGSAKVIFCTSNSSGSSAIRRVMEKSKGTATVFLDEAGQCTEADIFIPASTPRASRMIFLGDPKQLPATVIDLDCAAKGFGESFLSRIHAFYREKVHLLDTQYRMDVAILEYPNRRFYGQQIKSADSVHHRLPQINRPVVFLDTAGRGSEEKAQFSYRNSYEVLLINILLKQDEDIRVLFAQKQKTHKIRVIVITPYKQQASFLREKLKLPKCANNVELEVATVDSFQGQEADIVVLSTVRTRAVGFVDNARRLNVALTRAKRVLRIVGDGYFFKRIQSQSSTLKSLATFCDKREWTERSKVQSLPYCAPNWSQPQTWSLVLTQRFHNCLKGLTETSRNLALNTLFALTTPNVKALQSRSVKSRSGWQLSSLGRHDEVGVVWIACAKAREDSTSIGKIEAHFCGSRCSCLQFLQKNTRAPNYSCAVSSDMSSVCALEESTKATDLDMIITWKMSNGLQDAMLQEKVEHLPQAILQLDPQQEEVARAHPPLLIESRSGTGKTLVLLQHAASYPRPEVDLPACFVTVSTRLSADLTKKYNELRPILFQGLQPTRFFSFRTLVFDLVDLAGVTDFIDKIPCDFTEYYENKTSFEKVLVERHLLENEIGGVITGSLTAAQQHSPLKLEQYLTSKRSNIPAKNQPDVELRSAVYVEYRQYVAWKADNSRFDVGDVILKLIQRDIPQLFCSVYLDEVQDLSHAAIYLICSIAGKDSSFWICAGDPAQMISPGSSFTFAGLKETLRAVQPGIDSKLKEVHHLLFNYRTTKDILQTANSVLSMVKTHFPRAIDFGQPEQAKKDLGLKVVACSWSDAFATKVKLGENQAFVYSTSDSDTLEEDAKTWLEDHPFILSSLESKGLEFEDVIVAFDVERKIWDVRRGNEGSLRLLRELYVAITRAQRRVVILLKENTKAMWDFFLHDLECERMDAAVVLREFDRETTSEQWFERASALFQGQHYMLAASCFIRAERLDWSNYSKGLDSFRLGRTKEGLTLLRKSVRQFHALGSLKITLDILKLVVDRSTEWETTDDTIFLEALTKHRSYLSKQHRLKFVLLRECWELLGVEDLCEPGIEKYLRKYRSYDGFRDIIRGIDKDSIVSIGRALPWAIADYYRDSKQFCLATRLYLASGEVPQAIQTTECRLEELSDPVQKAPEIFSLVQLWKSRKLSYGDTPKGSTVSMMLRLFDDPLQCAKSEKPASYVSRFGKEAVRMAIAKAHLDETRIIAFGTSTFDAEVAGILTSRFNDDFIAVVEWFTDNGYDSTGANLARSKIKKTHDLIRLSLVLRTRPKWLFLKLKQLEVISLVVGLILSHQGLSPVSKTDFWSDYKKFNLTDERKMGYWKHMSFWIHLDDKKKNFSAQAMVSFLLENFSLGVWYSYKSLKETPGSFDLFEIWEYHAKRATSTCPSAESIASFLLRNKGSCSSETKSMICLIDSVTQTVVDPCLLFCHLEPATARYLLLHGEAEIQDRALMSNLQQFYSDLQCKMAEVQERQKTTGRKYDPKQGPGRKLGPRHQRKQKNAKQAKKELDDNQLQVDIQQSQANSDLVQQIPVCNQDNSELQQQNMTTKKKNKRRAKNKNNKKKKNGRK